MPIFLELYDEEDFETLPREIKTPRAAASVAYRFLIGVKPDGFRQVTWSRDKQRIRWGNHAVNLLSGGVVEITPLTHRGDDIPEGDLEEFFMRREERLFAEAEQIARTFRSIGKTVVVERYVEESS